MYKFAPGTNSVSIYFRLRDSSSGLEKTGLAYNSAGVQAAYLRAANAPVSITLVALATPGAAWTAGGFVEVDATKMPGLYRLDLPDAVCAVGTPFAVVSLRFTGVLMEAALVRLEQIASNVGPGSIPWTITVNNSETALPLSGALVWVTTDASGTNTIAGTLTTNAAGQTVFYLNAGTYYLFVSHPGYTGANPTTFVVS